MATTITGIERTVQSTYQWIDDMQDALSWAADRDDAYHGLKVGLHFLRDRLTPDEVAHLSAQLPMLVRGMYYEDWNPTDKPLTADSYDEISSYLSDAIDRDIPADPTLILRAVFAVLYKNISLGELEHVQSMLPATMRAFYPNIVETS